MNYGSMLCELVHFERKGVWELVIRPNSANIIGTKWIYKSNTSDIGYVTRNKARLLAHGYTQIEHVDFDETFAHVTHFEAIIFFWLDHHLYIKRPFTLWQRHLREK